MLDIGGVGFPDPDEKKKNAMLDAKVFTGPPAPPAPIQQPRPPGAMLNASSFTSQSPYVVPPGPGMLWQNDQFGYGGQWLPQRQFQPNFNVADVPANVPLLQQNAPAGYLPMQTRSDIPPNKNIGVWVNQQVTKAGDVAQSALQTNIRPWLSNLPFGRGLEPEGEPITVEEHLGSQVALMNVPYEKVAEPTDAKQWLSLHYISDQRKVLLARQREITKQIEQNRMDNLRRVPITGEYPDAASVLWPTATVNVGGVVQKAWDTAVTPELAAVNDPLKAELNELKKEEFKLRALSFVQNLATAYHTGVRPPPPQSVADVWEQVQQTYTTPGREARMSAEYPRTSAALEADAPPWEVVKNVALDNWALLRATPAEITEYREEAPALVQLFNNVVNDPLILVDVRLDMLFKANKLRQAGRFVSKIDESVDVVRVLRDADAVANTSAWRRLNPFRTLPASQANNAVKEAIDVLHGFSRDWAGDFSVIIPDLIANPDNIDLLKKTAGYSGSAPVKRAVVLIQDVIGSTDVGDIAKYMGDKMKGTAGNFDVALARISADIENAAIKAYKVPVRIPKGMTRAEVEAAGGVIDASLYSKGRFVRDTSNHYLSIAYMGYNPQFWIRNVSNNAVTMLADGIIPWMSTKTKQLLIDEWKGLPMGAKYGYGFASQTTKANTQAFKKAVEGLSKATGGLDIKTAVQGMSPTLVGSGVSEVIASETIVLQMIDKFWPQTWNPVVRDFERAARQAGLPEETIDFLRYRLRQARSVEAIDMAIVEAIGTPPAGAVGGPAAIGPVGPQPPLPGMPPAGGAGAGVATPPSSPWPGPSAAPISPAGPITGPPVPPVVTPPVWTPPTTLPPAAAQAMRPVIPPALRRELDREGLGGLFDTFTKGTLTQEELVQAGESFLAHLDDLRRFKHLDVASQAVGAHTDPEKVLAALDEVRILRRTIDDAHELTLQQTYAKAAGKDRFVQDEIFNDTWQHLYESRLKGYKQIADALELQTENVPGIRGEIRQTVDHLREDIQEGGRFLQDWLEKRRVAYATSPGDVRETKWTEINLMRSKEDLRHPFESRRFENDVADIHKKLPPKGAAQPSPASAVAGPPPPATAPSLTRPAGPALPQAVVGTQVAGGKTWNDVRVVLPDLSEDAARAVQRGDSVEKWVATLDDTKFARIAKEASLRELPSDPNEFFFNVKRHTKSVEPGVAASTGTAGEFPTAAKAAGARADEYHPIFYMDIGDPSLTPTLSTAPHGSPRWMAESMPNTRGETLTKMGRTDATTGKLREIPVTVRQEHWVISHVSHKKQQGFYERLLKDTSITSDPEIKAIVLDMQDMEVQRWKAWEDYYLAHDTVARYDIGFRDPTDHLREMIDMQFGVLDQPGTREHLRKRYGELKTMIHQADTVLPTGTAAEFPTAAVAGATPPRAVSPGPVAALQSQAAERVSSVIKVKDISLDPKRFQFKLSTDVRGVTKQFKDVKGWVPDWGRGISVWVDPADGKTYVVNGHHRVELAQRFNVDEIKAPYYIPAETAEDARLAGALQNIADDKGTALDAAKVFRDADFTPAILAGKNLSLSKGTVANGLALANLNDNLFASVVSGNLPIERAVIIGSKIPDHELQMQFVREIDKIAKKGSINNATVAELADAMVSGPKETFTTFTLFGADEVTRSYALERAKFLTYVKENIVRDKRAFGGAAKHADLLEQVGHINKAEATRLAAQADEVVRTLDRLKNVKGPISDIANEAAVAMGKGVKNAQETFYERLIVATNEAASTFGGVDIPSAGALGDAGARRAAEGPGTFPGLGAAGPEDVGTAQRGSSLIDDLDFTTRPTDGDPLGIVWRPQNPGTAGIHALNRAKKQVQNWLTQKPRMQPMSALNPQQAAELQRLRDEILFPKLIKSKAQVDDAAVRIRNFSLLDYSNRKGYNEALQWLYPYNFWFTGTYKNWAKRIAMKPALVNHYMQTQAAITEANQTWYRDMMNDPNAEMPEYYRGQLRLPIAGTSLFFDVMKGILPMYNALHNFSPKARTEAPFGKLYDVLSNWGPSIWTPVVMAYSGWLASIGEKEAAAQLIGYLTPMSKPIKSVTALIRKTGLPGTQIIPPGGIAPEGLIGIPHTVQGGDIWEKGRIGYFLARQWMEGDITAEEMEEAGNVRTGPIWDKAVQMEAEYKAWPNIIGFLTSGAFKPHTDQDVMIDSMWKEWGELLDSKATMSPEAWQQALIDFDEDYVWARGVRLARELDPNKKRADWGYMVLGRLPPGEERQDLFRELAIDKLVDRFYNAKGDMSDWDQVEIDKLTNAFDQIGKRYKIPTPDQREEFQKAKQNHAEIKTQAVNLLEDMGYEQAPWIDVIEQGYYAEGVDKPAYLEQWPILPMYWDLQRGVTDDNVDLKATEEEFYTSENERLNTEFWEEQLPPGSNWRKGLDLPPFVQAMLDEDSRPLLDEKEKQVAVDWLKANVPSAFKDLDEWPMAKRLNDQFREQVTAALGENVFELSALYGAMGTAQKAGWKKDYPNQYAELELYWDAKTAYGQKYPLWRKYYGFADEIPKSSPASTSASAGRGGGGGGVGGRGISQSVAAALPGTPTPLTQQSQVQPGTDYDALAAQVSTIMDDPGFISLVTKLFKSSFMLLLRRWLKMTPAERAAWALKNRADWHRIQAFLTWFMKQAQTGSPAADAGRIVQSVPRNAPVAPLLAAP